MWCLEQLLRGRDRILRSRARRPRASSPAACANVLTPDRIPEFCIPPRIAPRLAFGALRNSRREEAATDEGASRTDWDPRSQAALSLPHLPRARTAYGFCALLESPHTRRKESLFLGDPAPLLCARPTGAPAGDAALAPPRAPRAAPCPVHAAPARRPSRRRLLRAPDRLLSRALRGRRSRGPARARSVSPGDDHSDDQSDARARPPTPAAQHLEAEGAAVLDVDPCPRSGRLRLRLLRPEDPAMGPPEPRTSGRRLRLALRPPGTTREQRRLLLGLGRRAASNPGPDPKANSRCAGASEEPQRHLAARVPSGDQGHPRGRGSTLLPPLLLLL